MDQYVTIRKRPRVDVTQLYPDVWRLVAGVLEWPEVISLYPIIRFCNILK